MSLLCVLCKQFILCKHLQATAMVNVVLLLQKTPFRQDSDLFMYVHTQTSSPTRETVSISAIVLPPK